MDDYPVRPWDTPGLPPRRQADRCARHTHCAYRDDDPAYCSKCHSLTARCRRDGNPCDGPHPPATPQERR